MSRAQVVDAAMKLVAGDGYERLTVRGLAAELGVAPMSLYRHVRDKDDLLDEVVDRLLTTTWRPRCSERNWKIWIAEVANRLRLFLVAEPAALGVYLRHPVLSPAAMARMEAMMRVLRRATVDEDEACRAYTALQTYTIGFAALEASRKRWQPAEDDGALANQLAAHTTPEQFAEGLSYLLEGIRSTS